MEENKKISSNKKLLIFFAATFLFFAVLFIIAVPHSKEMTKRNVFKAFENTFKQEMGFPSKIDSLKALLTEKKLHTVVNFRLNHISQSTAAYNTGNADYDEYYEKRNAATVSDLNTTKPDFTFDVKSDPHNSDFLAAIQVRSKGYKPKDTYKVSPIFFDTDGCCFLLSVFKKDGNIGIIHPYLNETTYSYSADNAVSPIVEYLSSLYIEGIFGCSEYLNTFSGEWAAFDIYPSNTAAYTAEGEIFGLNKYILKLKDSAVFEDWLTDKKHKFPLPKGIAKEICTILSEDDTEICLYEREGIIRATSIRSEKRNIDAEVILKGKTSPFDNFSLNLKFNEFSANILGSIENGTYTFETENLSVVLDSQNFDVAGSVTLSEEKTDFLECVTPPEENIPDPAEPDYLDKLTEFMTNDIFMLELHNANRALMPEKAALEDEWLAKWSEKYNDKFSEIKRIYNEEVNSENLPK